MKPISSSYKTIIDDYIVKDDYLNATVHFFLHQNKLTELERRECFHRLFVRSKL